MQRVITRNAVHRYIAVHFGAIALLSLTSFAGVQEYFDDDRDAWFEDAAAIGSITTIGFNELGPDILVTHQYSSLGVEFIGNPNFTRGEDFIGFPEDGWGLDGNQVINLVFDSLQGGIATDHPGNTQFDLFFDGGLVYSSSRFGGGGAGRFGGVLGIEFDEVLIVDPVDSSVFLDDLHFVSIPAPATALVYLLQYSHFVRGVGRCANSSCQDGTIHFPGR